MTGLLGKIRRRLFGLSSREVSFEHRGFHYRDDARRAHLERVGGFFLTGFHHALEASNLGDLTQRLEDLDFEFQGFAYEGAAMALTIFDIITPGRRDRFKRFLDGPAANHKYIVHVGAGWAMARLTRHFERRLATMDPLLGWLTVDGYGFHEGFFHWRKYYEDLARPTNLGPYGLRVFDQGLGRCLWFVKGADVPEIIATIASFQTDRHEDLWSGLGLACTYAAGAADEEILELRRTAGPFEAAFAQGSAFAAECRLLAGNVTASSRQVCRLICDRDLEDAAAQTQISLTNLPFDDELPRYEAWRQRIQAAMIPAGVFQ